MLNYPQAKLKKNVNTKIEKKKKVTLPSLKYSISLGEDLN
jgi:hypothetical protein